MTWPGLIEWLMSQILLHGNGLLEIVGDQFGNITALNPIPWRCVTVSQIRSGILVYDVMPVHGIGPIRRLLSSEVIHARDRSDDGLVGRSRFARAPGAVRIGLDESNFIRSLWQNGAQPKAVIEVPKIFSDEAFERFKEAILENHAGVGNAGKTLILEEGAKLSASGITPEDAQVLASRKFTVEEVCRLLQIPPPLLQLYDNNTFTNSAQASIWFAQNTLAPWVGKLEAEFTRALFGSSGYELDLDLSSLMRGDFSARWASWQIAVANGILTPNEAREAEGFAPHPDGNALRVAPASRAGAGGND